MPAAVSTTARESENSNPIAPHTRFHACTRGRSAVWLSMRATHPSALDLARATQRPTNRDGDEPRGHCEPRPEGGLGGDAAEASKEP